MKAAVVPKESTMKDASSKKASVSESLLLRHTIPEDAAAMTAMRAAVQIPVRLRRSQVELAAAAKALDAVGEFLAQRLKGAAGV